MRLSLVYSSLSMGDRIGKDFCRDHDLGNVFRDPCGRKVSIKVGGVNLMQEEQQNCVGIAFYSVIDTSLHVREFS